MALDLKGYENCYKDTLSVTEYNYYGEAIEDIWYHLGHCYTYYMVDVHFKISLQLFSESIPSQCFTYEVYKTSINESDLM